MYFDITERLIVVKVRLKDITKVNHISKEVLTHLDIDHIVYLMIIYALGGHGY